MLNGFQGSKLEGVIKEFRKNFDSKQWQYGLWNFQAGGPKLERFLPKNQHTQRKLLNSKNWVNEKLSKSIKI